MQVLKLLGGQLFPPRVQHTLWFDGHRLPSWRSALVMLLMADGPYGLHVQLHPKRQRTVLEEIVAAQQRVERKRSHVADVTVPALQRQLEVRCLSVAISTPPCFQLSIDAPACTGTADRVKALH